MLLDIGSVLGGVGLAVVAFLVVILICVVILRMLAVILPSYEDRNAPPDPAVTEPEELAAPSEEEVPGEVRVPDPTRVLDADQDEVT